MKKEEKIENESTKGKSFSKLDNKDFSDWISKLSPDGEFKTIKNHGKIFIDEKFDGEALLNVTSETLLALKIPGGDVSKIMNEISKLKESTNFILTYFYYFQ